MIGHQNVRTFHRWVSVVIGLQLLAWTVSGLLFTWHPIEVVRGEAFLSDPALEQLAADEPLVAFDAAWRASGLQAIARARLSHERGRWSWVLFAPGAETPVLVDARSGELLPALDAAEASAIATSRFTASQLVTHVRRVSTADGEYRGKPLPAWCVTFDDERNSNVYVDAGTGAITSVRNDTWRRFDFFWMLHIMDYSERKDFHHPLLTSAAALGVTTALTGLWLAILVLRPRRASPPAA